MNALQRFIVDRAVSALWMISVSRRLLRISFGKAKAALSRPYAGLATGIEMLDGSSTSRAGVRKVVVWLRNPLRLLAGSIARSGRRRRAWLVRVITSLPTGPSISYVLHYWDNEGRALCLLTRDPLRGLRPPCPGRSLVPGDSDVMAAYHAGRDVTPDIKRVSSSFRDDEGGVCPVALDAYLRYRRGVGLRSHPVVVTDAALNEREYYMVSGDECRPV